MNFLLTALTVALFASPPNSTALATATTTATSRSLARPQTGPLVGPWVFTDLRLSPRVWPADIDGPAAYQQYLSRRADELLHAVTQATDPAGRTAARLKLAHWQLSKQIEPALTRLILNIDSDLDRKTITQIASADGQQLAPATAALNLAIHQSAQLERLREFLAVLQPWPDVFAAVAGHGNHLLAAQRLDALACSQSASIAQAARFWQAVLYHQARQYQQALDSLDLALADPRTEYYSLLPRLLRCRILADRGQLTVALALLIRLQDHLDDWFDPAPAQLAEGAAVLLRLELLDRLAQRLEHAGHHDQAQSLRTDSRRLRDQTFPTDRISPLPRLAQVLPELEPTTTTTTTTDAPHTHPTTAKTTTTVTTKPTNQPQPE